MTQIQIAEATVAHIPIIRNIAMASWPVTYSSILSVAQIEYMLGSFYNPAELQTQMESGSQVFLLAYLENEPVGFAAYGPQDDAKTFKLHKLYILPQTQKSGVGKALLNNAISRIKQAGGNRLILNVHRNNPAKNYYEKLGFRIYEVKDIPLGPGFVLNDYLMEKEL